jgi:hypothetical protein
LQYTAFDQLKQRLLKRQQRKNAESTVGSSPVVISTFSAFLVGAIAKSIATVLTYPLIRFVNFLAKDLNLGLLSCFCLLTSAICRFLSFIDNHIASTSNRCKTMIQAADDESDDDESERAGKSRTPKTMLGALRAIWSKEGIPGFYKGLHAQILKTVLSSALLLMIKEKISKFTWVSLLALRRYLFVTPKRIKSA